MLLFACMPVIDRFQRIPFRDTPRIRAQLVRRHGAGLVEHEPLIHRTTISDLRSIFTAGDTDDAAGLRDHARMLRRHLPRLERRHDLRVLGGELDRFLDALLHRLLR
ncbi:hypothetical protein NHL51_04555 [Leucobacter sp. gxy201]|uniref:hypothetical protein n=1 Tax=Leucobacter sp. gxy201 TaxID=2957200 RepID=UPI003DA0FC48